jgi:hypothetical protein
MTILSFATKSYLQAYERMIPSWLDKAEEIVVYTDGHQFPEYPNVRQIPLAGLGKDNREDAFADKILIIDEYFKDNPAENVAYLDMDCFVFEKFDEVFEHDFDIAGTKWDVLVGGKMRFNAGVIFFKKGEGVRVFIEDWKRKSLELKSKNTYLYEQTALEELLNDSHTGQKLYKMKPLPQNIYNNRGDDNRRWKAHLSKTKAKIIHFKAGRWMDERLIAEMLQSVKKGWSLPN